MATERNRCLFGIGSSTTVFVWQTPTTNLTAWIGAYGARIYSKGHVSANATVNGESYSYSDSASYGKTAYAPGVGVSLKWRPQDTKWDFRVGAQGFRTEWGDFDQDGHFINATASASYWFNNNWAAFAGYDWFELKLKDKYTGSADYDGIVYTGQANVSGRLRVHGPSVGLRAAF